MQWVGSMNIQSPCQKLSLVSGAQGNITKHYYDKVIALLLLEAPTRPPFSPKP